MLDAAFMLNGRAYGMVCCEETRRARDWRVGDVSALRAIVTRLALLMSGAPDSVLLEHAVAAAAGACRRSAAGTGRQRTAAGKG